MKEAEVREQLKKEFEKMMSDAVRVEGTKFELQVLSSEEADALWNKR